MGPHKSVFCVKMADGSIIRLPMLAGTECRATHVSFNSPNVDVPWQLVVVLFKKVIVLEDADRKVC